MEAYAEDGRTGDDSGDSGLTAGLLQSAGKLPPPAARARAFENVLTSPPD